MGIKVDGFSAVIMADIEALKNKGEKEANEILENMGKDALSRVKESSPVFKGEYSARNSRTPGEYKNGWRLKKENKYGIKVRRITNEKAPSLTHLIENGTTQRFTKSGANRGVMTPKQAHIRRSFDEVSQEYENKYFKD